ncbi:MAG: hypothetical protein IKK57_10290 [Clostridia bacterium]|nr:hypothetical protein [Clostridia bacterium]
MYRKDNRQERRIRRPEFRPPEDALAVRGRQLRNKIDEMRPQSDMKHWR